MMVERNHRPKLCIKAANGGNLAEKLDEPIPAPKQTTVVEGQMLSSIPTSLSFPPSPKLNQTHHKKSSSSSPQNSQTSTDLLHNFNLPFELKQIHAHLIKTNTPLSILPLTRIAFTCALTPSFYYAHQIFNLLDNTQIFLWNSCLRSYAEGKSPRDAISLFYRLREFDVSPDTFTCSFLLKACTSLSDLKHGRIIHGFIEKLGFRPNVFLENSLVYLYAYCCDAIDDARKVFDTMSERDIVSWNIMITQLVKRGDVNGAHTLFRQMPSKNVRSWTAMVSGFVQCGKPKEAIELFEEMEQAGVTPNEVTVVAVLAACADLGALDLGKRVHDDYSNSSSGGHARSNVRICNTLIDMYIKCGCLEAARKVFDEMLEEEKTIVSWSAMIAGLAMHGLGSESLDLFYEMRQKGIRPNEVTFIGLLYACSHMGLVDKGREFFHSMINQYRITPEIEHYGCMVDLYSRAGLLHEAHQFIKTMPIKPNSVVWGALLGGCRVHKNIQLAEVATQRLLELDAMHDGYYVVLSNIYAEAQRWEDVARVRKMMRDRGVKKTPGWSLITVDGDVHEFVAGDSVHPEIDEIYKGWEDLLPELKRKGYVPNTSVVLLDMEEDEKVKVVYKHSEKLALVYGLIKTVPNTTVRIMKNLRVCEDCHEAFKLTSGIVDREIVVRDRNRFHCFRDGSCSCRDYW